MYLILSLIGFILCLIWIISKPFYWKLRGVPSLSLPLPILGNTYRLFTLGNYEFFKYLHNQFPNEKYFGYHLFTEPVLYVKDIKLLNYIFVKGFQYFSSHGAYSNPERDPGGSNLFHTGGQQWKEWHSKLILNFSAMKIKAMLYEVEKSVEKLIHSIDNKIVEMNPIDVKKLMMTANTDAIARSIFGAESDVFENENSAYLDFAVELTSPSFMFSFLLSIISSKTYDLVRATVFSEYFDRFIKDMLSKTMEQRRKKNIEKLDFIQGMMKLMDTESKSKEKYFPDGTNVPKYNMDTIISQAMVIFAAGTEATALTMTFCLHELATHPEVQEKCRKEIMDLLKEKNCEKITPEFVNELPYLTSCVNEILRLHGPGIVIPRRCTETCKLPDTDLIIEKGTMIFTSPLLTHNDTKYFPDPHLFKPERFYTLDKNYSKPEVYIPFGLGPRTCLGTRFAKPEMNLFLARLLQRYTFTVSNKTQIPIKYAKYAFLVNPADVVWLNVNHVMAN